MSKEEIIIVEVAITDSSIDLRLSWNNLSYDLRLYICKKLLFNFYSKPYMENKLIKRDWNELIKPVQKILISQGIRP